MTVFDDDVELLQRPWLIGTALPPVRPQISLAHLSYQSFRDSLLQELGKSRPLAIGESSSITDATVALADAWAVVGDILGFYQERSVNESYIGTARERGSVFELARMVAYPSDQGLAASCYVYYTIDESVLRDVRIPAGSKVRAMPQPGGSEPQTFETRKDLIARAEWNAMRPATTRNADVGLDTDKIYLAGTDGGLKPSDLLVVIDRRRRPEGREIYFLVRGVEFDRPGDQTIAQLALRYPATADLVPDAKLCPVKAVGDVALAEMTKRDTDPLTTPAYYQSQMRDQAWVEANVKSRLDPPTVHTNENPRLTVIAFRKRVQVFGHNAPQRIEPARSARQQDDQIAWTLDLTKIASNVIDLEGHHPGILPNSRLCLEIPNRTAFAGDLEVFTVKVAVLTSSTDFGMTGNVTRLTLDRDWRTALWSDSQSGEEAYKELVQRVTVHVDDVNLRLGMMPIDPIGAASEAAPASQDNPKAPAKAKEGVTPEGSRPPIIEGQVIELDRIYLGLEPGHQVILDGEPPAGLKREEKQEPELLTILNVYQPPYPQAPRSSEVSASDGARSADAKNGELPVSHSKNAGEKQNPGNDERPRRTIVTFKESLKYRYDPKSVKIYGNVVDASHGEAYEEVLGSGDSAREHQSFALNRKPLTQLPIAAYPGAKPEISVKVGGEEWTHVATLASAGPEQRVYDLRIDENATARVTFGGGRTGARLPTGRENVSVRYRVGLGSAGNIGRGRLKIAVDQPLGVQSVSNIRATGGSDPESLSRMRINVPLSTVALERLVARGDYLSFARTYPGIAKAKALPIATPAGDVVVVSVLTNGIEPPSADDRLCKALRAALVERGDGAVTVYVKPAALLALCITARVKIRPEISWDDATTAIRSALNEAFGFERREIGQPAHASEVLAVIHSVSAVEFAVLEAFYPYDRDAPPDKQSYRTSIEACAGAFDATGKFKPAVLLLVQPHMPSTVVLQQERP